MCQIRASTNGAFLAPNARALLAFKRVPFAPASPIAIRHAISRAVIARKIPPPTIRIRTPTRVVRKNRTTSASAITRVPVRDAIQRTSSTVAGVSSANATPL